MIHDQVPWPIIHAIVYSNGRRLPKLIREIPPEPVTPLKVVLPKTQVVYGPSAIGLSEDDLRYWVGEKRKDYCTGYGKCRWCGYIRYTNQARKDHFRMGVCRTLIGQVSTYLKPFHLCVCCMKRTACLKWGMPFCSDECRDKFRYGEPDTWKQAKAAVERANRSDNASN